MRASRLSGTELAAVLGAAVLIVALFLPWYETSDNPNANIDGQQGAFSGWEAHPVLRWLLLASAAAPLILAYIVVRDHALSWARGEMTAVVTIAAFGLLAYNGLVDRPGDPSGQIALQYGYFLALAGVIAMVVGSALRSTEGGRARKPPGIP